MTADEQGRSRQRLAERIVLIIEGVVDAGQPVGPRGLARALGIDRSAVARTLQQLADLGILERASAGYGPGARLFTLGRVLGALDTLPNAVGPILQELVDRFNETCYLCALHGDVAMFIYEVQSSQPLRLVVELGKPVSLHAGAGGRAILAGLPPTRARSILEGARLQQDMPDTITDLDALIRLAAADADRGYSLSRQERVEGGSAIAAPFYDHSGECQGSVVFTAPLTRLADDRVDEIGQAVKRAAQELSERLGFVPLHRSS